MRAAVAGNPEVDLGSAVSRPLYFGPPQRPLFGWLYTPRHPSATTLGCVICNPFGDEAIRAHRSMRYLAAAIARAGIPAVRFDYDGAGDSAGHDLDSERLRHWLASIRSAAAALRESASVEHICFAGVRLGATLATLVASEEPKAAGLAAIAPVVSGKAYIRELRLLRKAMEAKRNIVRRDGEETLESAGFLLSAATQAELSAVDLIKANLPPPPRVLILDRAEMPGDERWPTLLREHGARVEHARVPGYTEMMLDSHDSIVPREIIAATVKWLREVATHYPHPSGGSTQPQGSLAATRVTLPSEALDDPITGSAPDTSIEESAVGFGEPPGLFGIISSPQPAASQPAAGVKAVLLLNSGAVHHIGPCRLYVALARNLARRGYVVLRMDMAGLGDSPPRPGQPDNVVYPDFALQNVTAAIEYLRLHWGAGEVNALGLCSGAYHAFKAAAARVPLRGVVLINPLTFFWKEGMSLEYAAHRIASDIGRYRKNVRRLSSWRKLFAGNVALWDLTNVLRRHALTSIAQPLRALARRLRIPLNDDLPTELLHIARAGIDLHFIFAADDPGVELLRSQGGATARTLRNGGKLGQELIPDADHTFTDLAARASLARLVISKLETA